jgi:DNA polymerase-1
MVNYGIAYGLSAFGLADRLQISREEAASTSSATSSASRRSSASSTRRSRPPRRRVRLHAAGPRRAIPSCAQSQRQRRSLGERLAVNTVIQGTAADIIKLAMLDCHAALADSDMQTRSYSRSTTSSCSRDPGRRWRTPRVRRREMCAAFDLDPPLAVDIGIGSDWLSAK